MNLGRPKLPTPEKYCERCGKRLERRMQSNGYLEPLYWFNKRKFCSLLCANRRKTLEECHASSVAWSRELARRIAEDTPCADCGKQTQTEVHHIDKNPFNNSQSNLIRLCRSCHSKRHRSRSLCIVCGRSAKAKKLCTKHYQQLRNGVSVEQMIEREALLTH